jgi:protoporphyrinogen oxidase
VRRRHARRRAVAVEGGEVHLLQRVEDEEGEVVLGKPVGDRRREQVELVTLGGEEVVGHDVIVAIGPLQVVDLTRALPGLSQIVSRGSCNTLVDAGHGAAGGGELTGREPAAPVDPSSRHTRAVPFGR